MMTLFNKSILTIFFVAITLFAQQVNAQQIDTDKLSREDILNMSYEELLDMEFEDVMQLAEKMGVSLDELYEMLLNKKVLSASKKAESSFEAPLSTTVLSYDEIVASGARNIEEALRLVPGMIVREKTTGNYDVHIRGNDNIPSDNLFLYSENSMSLVMIDGRQVYNYVNGGTFWESLPIDIADIDRIEIVRGPASALYGANAATGVIHIITKKPDNNKLGVNGSFELGNLSTKIANINVGQAVSSKFGYRVSGNYQYMERTSDKLYSLGLDSMYAVQDLFSLRDPQFPWLSFADPNDGDGTEKYPTPHKARDRYGINGFLFYDASDKINTRLSFGTQYSDVLTSTFGDQQSPLSTRYSKTTYLDAYAKIHGLTLQANYNWGYQDIVVGDEGFKVDVDILNAMAEYDFEFGGFSVRPGVYFQETTQNDLPYLTSEGNGFLNAKQTLQSVAGSLRGDYKVNGFRLIGALRAEKYNVNDDVYLPFQLTASYDLKGKQHFRINYSRANRSPFLADTYANYEWDRSARRFPNTIKFEGTENLKLATVDMLELGYRVKPAKNIQVDLELFYSIAKDFGYLSPDTVIGSFTQVSYAPTPAIPEYVHMAYQNTEVESNQLGVTLNIAWVINENLIIKANGTYQETKLKNYYPLNTNEIVERMMVDAGTKLAMGQNFLGTTTTTFFEPAGVPAYPSMLAYSSTRPDATVDEADHKSTPSFYGGLSVNYKAFDQKLGVFLSSYFYSKQEYKNQYGMYEIPAKSIFSTKISYKVFKENAVFFNARNVLNNKEPEFGWLDEVYGVYMLGLDIKF